MALESSKGAPAYNIPLAVKKKSWAKKRKMKRRKKNPLGLSNDLMKIYKKNLTE